MSLLNDMLKDLSTQKPPVTIRLPLPILPTPSYRRFMYWGIFGGIASVVISSLFFISWQSEPQPEPVIPMVPIIPISVIPSIPPFPVKQPIEEPVDLSSEPNEVLPDPEAEVLPDPEVVSEGEESPPELTADNSVLEGSAQFSIKSDQELQKKLINQYISEGNLQRALKQVDEILRVEPHRLSFIYLKARLFAERGRYKEAIILLESHNPSIQKHAKFYALEAAIYEALGRTEEAGGIYQTLLKLHPENGRYWLGLAIALEHKQAFQQAIEAYRHAGQSDVTTTAIRSYAAERLSILKG